MIRRILGFGSATHKAPGLPACSPPPFCVPRLVGNLGIRLMRPLARRTHKDQWRGPRAYNPDEPREFLMGRTTDSWRTAETWIRCLASHGLPLHAAAGLSAHPDVAHLATEPGILGSLRSVLANQFDYQRSFLLSSEAGSHELSGASPMCGMGSLAGLSGHRRCTNCGHRSFNRSNRRAVHGRCMPVPLPPSTLGGDNWTMASRRLSPYRPGAPPRRKLPALTNFAGPSLSRATTKQITIPTNDLPRTTRVTNQ